MSDLSLTVLNRYELRASKRKFDTAIVALASRVRREGHPGVLSYRFIVNEGEKAARAVIE